MLGNRKVILVALLVFLLVSGFMLYLRPIATSVRLNLTGTPGLKVTGTYAVDGLSREFSGVLPTNISVKARSFVYTIYMEEPRGKLQGGLIVNGGLCSGSSSTANDFSGVSGNYTKGWFSSGVKLTTVRKAGDH